MQLRNPPTLYTGGAVTFDSSPTVEAFARLQERNQQKELAKQDAFDTYIRGLNTKINAAGKRTVDDEAFKHFYDKWQKFGLENKTKLQRGDIETQSEFNARYQDLLNLVQESKQAEEGKKPIIDIMVDPNKRAQLSEGVFPAIAAHDQPLYIKDKSGEYVRNPNRKQFDFTENIYDPQLDMAKHFESLSKGYKMDERIGETIKRDDEAGTITKEQILYFSPETKRQIGVNAANAYAADPKVRNYYQYKFDKLIKDKDEKSYEELNKIYQNTFGKGTEYVQPDGRIIKESNVIDSPEKLAAAEALREAGVEQKKEKEVPNRELAFRRAQVNINLNRGDGNEAPIRDVFNEIDGLVSNKPGGNLPLNELSTTAQSVVLKQARDLMGDNDLGQERVYVTKRADGKIVIRKTKKARVISADDPVIGEMDFVGTNVPVQVDVKGKRTVVEQGGQKPADKPKAIKPRPY